MVLKKEEIELALYEENQAISAGKLKEDNPLDVSDEFRVFCEACRRGDLKVCQEKITEGVNINARDRFDYTPLILASLCGHYEVVRLLLESGALCERDTFQGERCLYNALNDRIRNLLLSYDYSKSTNPLQPLAAHITSLLTRQTPKTSDLTLVTANECFYVHKFVLAARSPYFARKLATAPDTSSWRLPNTVPSESLQAAVKFLYLAEVAVDFGEDEEERDILAGVDKLSKSLEIERLFENMIEGSNRRLVRQRREEEVSRGRDELEVWFKENVLRHKIEIDSSRAGDVKWDRSNGIFADVLLRADEAHGDGESQTEIATDIDTSQSSLAHLIPIGPLGKQSRSPSRTRNPSKSVLFPAHKAMLLRSEFFATMFSSGFREAQVTEYLQIIPIACPPEVLQVILTYLYTEKSDFPLDIAIDVLFAADLLFIDKLKIKAAQIISTLGSGDAALGSGELRGNLEREEMVDIYDVVRAGWDTRVQRLEEFGARYIAFRLERYIDEDEFLELVKESASRVRARQETDTIELIDDIRYYLSDRFRLRLEDTCIEEMIDDNNNEQTQEGFDKINDETAPLNSDDTTQTGGVVIRTLNGELVDDEFAQDAINYQFLLNKVDALLDKLKLDA